MSFNLDTPRASDQQLAALFHNIMVDDEVNLSVACPTDVTPDCNQEELNACYRISWQLLVRGIDLVDFRRMIARIAVRREASPDERIYYKEVRARFKHMRFGCANFDVRHRYPWQLHFITSQMGFLQDAFKSGQKFKTCWMAAVLWIVLLPLPFKLVQRRIENFLSSNPPKFREFQCAEIAKLAKALASGEQVTGQQFHSLRKIISRRTAFVDTLRIIRPSQQLNNLSAYLATINGLMGDMHDELLLKEIRGELDYHKDKFLLPDPIAVRLRKLIDAHLRKISYPPHTITSSPV